jgi:hypothetical protein
VAIVVRGLEGKGTKRTARAQAAAKKHEAIPAVESGLLPWQLSQPLSREVVVPGAGNRLLILGGLRGSASLNGIESLDPATGAARSIGSLPAGVHDAAGGVVAGQDLVFGGGSPTTVAGVESFTPAGGGGSSAGGSAAASGQLPQPRSDATAASIGGTTYIVGGYDGKNPDAAVLGTRDGRTFRRVATLSVPVRYPAVAAAAGKVYVFGGQAISGAQAGNPVDDIQMVDPRARSSTVVGHLPEPLQAAAAVTLNGTIYVSGGDTNATQPAGPQLGTTQLSPPVNPTATAGLTTVSTIWAFKPPQNRMLVAGRLQVPVSHAGVAVLGSRAWLIGGESGGNQLASVQMLTPNASFGTAGASGAGSPYFGGKLLLADRANNRLLLLNPAMQIVWRFPSPSLPHDHLGFYFPDDAFFVRHGTAILSNQEQNETIQEIAYPSGRVLWSYGHPRQIGTAPGYLHEPDDAYLLKNGDVTVADADNCRVLVIRPNHTLAHQIGTAGLCAHNPPHALDSDNGDTPLADGNLLVSEITDSRVTEYTPSGHVVWSCVLPISYPSDPQQIGSDLYLIADYTNPGQILEFNRAGKVLYRYDVSSGPGMLNQPSLVEHLPSGVFMVNDDYRNRMVAIDPATRALVWQYGVSDRAGTANGMLRIPDGFDLLMPGGVTPTHPQTG